MLPDPAVPGSCLVSLHFLCYILGSRSVADCHGTNSGGRAGRAELINLPAALDAITIPFKKAHVKTHVYYMS